MTKAYSALQITGSSLLISGVTISAVLRIGGPEISTSDWAFLIAFSVLPLLAALTYVIGLVRIGASMTSTIGSFSIGSAGRRLSKVILPSIVPLAIIGGILGVFGILLVHKKQGNELL